MAPFFRALHGRNSGRQSHSELTEIEKKMHEFDRGFNASETVWTSPLNSRCGSNGFSWNLAMNCKFHKCSQARHFAVSLT